MTETIGFLYGEVRALSEQGMGAKEIALTLSISRHTVYRARKALGVVFSAGVPYTCEECDRVTLFPGKPGPEPEVCPRCGSPAYPEVSDTEALKRLTALVQRLEAEDRACHPA